MGWRRVVTIQAFSVWALTILCFSCVVSAQAQDWINSPINKQEENVGHYIGPDCVTQTIKRFTYIKNPITNDFYDITDMCIQAGDKYSLATDGARTYLRLGDDDIYRQINLSKYATVIPGSDRVLDRVYQGLYEPTGLVSYDDFSKQLVPNKSYDLQRVESYMLGDPSKKYLKQIDPQSGTQYQNVFSFAISHNGRYLVAYTDYANIMKIDLLTGEETLIAKSGSEWYMSYSIPRAGAISNDGRYVYVSAIEKLYDTFDCGSITSSTTPMLKCASREFGDLLGENIPYTSVRVHFSPDDLTLYMAANPIPGVYVDSKQLTLTLKDLADRSKLDYLALGDSYSSGEGDIGRRPDGTNFYLPGTDYQNGCHLSTRSYPFLLTSLMHITDDRMKSVACSGARVKQDYLGDPASYQGQGDRIKNETADKQQTLKADALRDFTPGITKQIDFVKANKPAFITLTGGGNDVGFANILTYCALPSGYGESSNTCDVAVTGRKQNSVLGDAITTQYSQTLQLIAAIKAASSNTKIYIIGYPSFVSNEKSACLNSAFLNKKERTMINQGVAYLNKVLRQAANAGGAFYIDIEKSLYGGRICEGSSYMTGPLAVLGPDMINHQNEMFHPNYLAHQAIAKTIFAAGVSPEGDNPSPEQNITQPARPAFFGTSTSVPTFQDKLVRDGAIYAGKALLLSVSPGVFAANEALNFTIWSDETKLGSLNTDSQGKLDEALALPHSIKPGYHMIVAEGRSPTGEMARIYQFIEVQGSTTDEDGDGEGNDIDQCEFMTQWYDEQTGEDICSTAASSKVVPPMSTAHNTSDVVSSPSYISTANSERELSTSGGGSVLGARDSSSANQAPAKNITSHETVAQLVFGLIVVLITVGFSSFLKSIRLHNTT